MTPQQALSFLDQIVAKVSLPREAHVQAQNASKVLLDAISAKPSLAPKEIKNSDKAESDVKDIKPS